MSNAEVLEEELRETLDQEIHKSLDNLVSIRSLLERNWVDEVFKALEDLEPALVARIAILPNYEEDFVDGFHYPAQKAEKLAKVCVKYNNGNLLSILQNVAEISQEYALQFYEHHLDTSEKVQALQEKMTAYLYASDSLQIVNAYISDSNYELLLAKAIVPHPQILYLRQLLRFYYEGRSPEDLRFWVGLEYAELKKVKIWSMYKLSYLESYRNKRDSYPFLFTYPDELYSSLRPKTDMRIFRLPSANKFDSALDYLPVVRYATSMSGSLFFGEERPQTICGRFYYFEPESQTFLGYRKDKMLRGFNKVDIYHQIVDRVQEVDRRLAEALKREYLEVIKQEEGRRVELHRGGMLRKDLKYTAYEAYTMFDVEYADGSEDVPPRALEARKETEKTGAAKKGRKQTRTTKTKSKDKFYMGNKLGLYAAEDELDQVICSGAKVLGYDIVFLEAMVGAYQVVSEVLDVRNNSFSYLVFKG